MSNMDLQGARLRLRSLLAGLDQGLDTPQLVVDFDEMTGKVVIARGLPSGHARKQVFEMRHLVALARFAELPLDADAAPPEAPKVEPRTLARRKDPSTSQQAAQIIAGKVGKIQQEVLRQFNDAGSNGLTDYELEAICGSHASTYRTRRAELAQAGRIYNTGRTRVIAGRKRIVWAIAPTTAMPVTSASQQQTGAEA